MTAPTRPRPPPLASGFETLIFISALVDGNLEAAITFFELYEVNPKEALAALAVLAAGDHKSHHTHRVSATSILLSVLSS